MKEFTRFREIVARLRGEGGCPWDRAQTHESLKATCIEEAAEVGLRQERCFVIGGESVYRQMFPWIRRVYVTELDACPESDSFFPDLSADPE